MNMKKVESKNSKSFDAVHNFLEKPINRGLMLFPPLFFCIIGVIVALIHAYSNFGFTIPFFVRFSYIGCAIWLLISLGIILWSDSKRVKK